MKNNTLKKLLAMGTTAALMASLVTPVMAETVQMGDPERAGAEMDYIEGDAGNTYETQHGVFATFNPDDEGQSQFYVTVDWGTLTYEYTPTWKYDETSETKHGEYTDVWTPEDTESNKIAVTNYSSFDIDAAFTFAGDGTILDLNQTNGEDYQFVNMKDESTIGAGQKMTIAKDPASVPGTPNPDPAETLTAALTLTATPKDTSGWTAGGEAVTNSERIGTVTVAIAATPEA